MIRLKNIKQINIQNKNLNKKKKKNYNKKISFIILITIKNISLLKT